MQHAGAGIEPHIAPRGLHDSGYTRDRRAECEGQRCEAVSVEVAYTLASADPELAVDGGQGERVADVDAIRAGIVVLAPARHRNQAIMRVPEPQSAAIIAQHREGVFPRGDVLRRVGYPSAGGPLEQAGAHHRYPEISVGVLGDGLEIGLRLPPERIGSHDGSPPVPLEMPKAGCAADPYIPGLAAI